MMTDTPPQSAAASGVPAGSAAAAPPSAAPAGGVPSSFKLPVEVRDRCDLTDLEAGHFTREDVNAARVRDGYPELPTPSAAEHAVSVTAAAQEIDAAFPPAKPMDYDLTGLFPQPEGDTAFDPAAMAADQQTRAWLSEARFPTGIGSALAQEVGRFAPEWEAMNDGARGIHNATTMAQLTRMHGGEAKALERIGMARVLIHALSAKHPDILDFVARSGAGSNLFAINQLAMHAERLAARKGLSAAQIEAQFPDLFTDNTKGL